MNGEQSIRTEAARSGFETIADDVVALARPALHLVPAVGDAPVAGRLGGLPRLPAGTAWPQTRWTTLDPEPLTFFGELDLAALDRDVWGGPTEGALSFFCSIDADALYADSGGSALVLHHQAAEARVPVDFPAELHEDLRLREFEVQARPVVTLPSIGVGPAQQLIPLGLDAMKDLEQADRYDEMLERIAGERAAHRLLGWPRFIQDDIAYTWPMLHRQALEFGLSSGDVAESQWRLLLEIGSDDALGSGFGDGGKLFFAIPEEDLRRGRFDRVQAITDSG